MKTFAYTYRDLSGALKRASLQALDRAAALRQIQAQGHVPVSVTEGAPKAGFDSRLPFSPRILVLAGSVVLLLVSLVAVYLMPGKTRSVRSERVRDTVKQDQRTTSVADDRSTPIAPAIGARDTDRTGSPKSSDTPVVTIPAGTNNTAAAAHAIDTPDMAKSEPQAEPIRPQPFKTTTEQLLSMMTSIPPGTPMPPLPVPQGMGNDYSLAKTNILEIYDTDNEKMTQTIETVAWAKVDLDALVKQGWKPEEVLRELSRLHNEEADLRSNASMVLKKMSENGKLSGPELKEELLQINSELAERGLPEITLEELGVDND